MYHTKSHPKFLQNLPYQQSNQTNKQDLPNFFQQQPFGPRFQPPQQLSPPRPFYQPQQFHDTSRLPCHTSLQSHTHFQSINSNFDHNIPKPSFPSPVQNFETAQKSPHQNPQYPPSFGPSFHQPSSPFGTPDQPFVSPIQNYNQPPIQNLIQSPIQNLNQPPHIQNLNQPPHIQNLNQPPHIQNLNQPPHIQNLNQPPHIQNLNQPPHIQNLNQPHIQNLNQPPPTQNLNQPPPVQSFNQPSPNLNYNNHPPVPNFNQPPPATSYSQPINGHQPMCFPPSSEYGPTLNVPYQPQLHNYDSLKQPYKLPRPQFNQRPPFRLPGKQRFLLNQQHSRYQQPQQGNNRFQFHLRQLHQNYRFKGPPSINNQPYKSNYIPKKDKIQISCEMGNCDFVGHASAVKEHQNLHHRFGLHKKVLYSNNSDAVKNWIQERKKKWPTKENIQIKLDVKEEKNKRGERIADEDFQRFNKNNKSNYSGSKRTNNRRRRKYNGEVVEPVEDPMNGNLKRFAGIVEIQKLNDTIDKTIKPVALKLIEEYDKSSDDEPPNETAIIKESASQDIVKAAPNEKQCSSTPNIKSVPTEHNKQENITVLTGNESEVVNSDLKVETRLKVNNEYEKTITVHSQKRKKLSKKEIKPIKKTPPLRTPRTEIVERKNALLEALMGDLMRSERNAITQCICYIRNNMHRFYKIQAA